MLMYDWRSWLGQYWMPLCDGSRLVVPSWLPHPSTVGFKHFGLASPAGQVADWALSLRDESRIHIHEYKNGLLVAHRDKHDPERGPVKAVAHFFYETPLGQVAAKVVITSAIMTLLYSAIKRRGK